MMIKFAFWNINGFKLEKLENEHFYKQFDSFGISESWTNVESTMDLSGYRSIVVHGTKGNRKRVGDQGA